MASSSTPTLLEAPKRIGSDRGGCGFKYRNLKASGCTIGFKYWNLKAFGGVKYWSLKAFGGVKYPDLKDFVKNPAGD